MSAFQAAIFSSTLAFTFILGMTAAAAQPASNAGMPPPQDVRSACSANVQGPYEDLHVEVRDEFGLWRAGESVEILSMDGLPLVAVNCEGPWVNFALVPGKYRVVAFLGPKTSQQVEVDVLPSGTTVTLMLESPPNPPDGEYPLG